jgi:DNA-binding transcriptional LysR family regulator
VQPVRFYFTVLDPRRLDLLVALSSLGTVRAVAAHASMSPSAVSQQLATLEAESGVALLSRHGRSVALTPAGEALVARAADILDRIALAEDELRGRHGETTGVVRVGAFASALGAFVIDAARDLADAHPGLRVQLSELEPERTVPALERGAIDIAIVGDFGDGSVRQADDVERTALASDELLAILPADHPHRGAAIRLEELRDARWLMDGTDLERHVVARCRSAGFEPAIDGRLSSHETLLHAVAVGLGVTVLPSFALARSAAVRTCRLKPVAHRKLLALTRAGAARRPPVAVTRDAIVAAARRVAS